MTALQQIGEDIDAVRTTVFELQLAAVLERPPREGLDRADIEWVTHLAWLKRRLAAGALLPSSLEDREAAGLDAMEEQRQKLDSLIVTCPKCNLPTRRGIACDRCKKRMGETNG